MLGFQSNSLRDFSDSQFTRITTDKRFASLSREKENALAVAACSL